MTDNFKKRATKILSSCIHNLSSLGTSEMPKELSEKILNCVNALEDIRKDRRLHYEPTLLEIFAGEIIPDKDIFLLYPEDIKKNNFKNIVKGKLNG